MLCFRRRSCFLSGLARGTAGRIALLFGATILRQKTHQFVNPVAIGGVKNMPPLPFRRHQFGVAKMGQVKR